MAINPPQTTRMNQGPTLANRLNDPSLFTRKQEWTGSSDESNGAEWNQKAESALNDDALNAARAAHSGSETYASYDEQHWDEGGDEGEFSLAGYTDEVTPVIIDAENGTAHDADETSSRRH